MWSDMALLSKILTLSAGHLANQEVFFFFHWPTVRSCLQQDPHGMWNVCGLFSVYDSVLIIWNVSLGWLQEVKFAFSIWIRCWTQRCFSFNLFINLNVSADTKPHVLLCRKKTQAVIFHVVFTLNSLQSVSVGVSVSPCSARSSFSSVVSVCAAAYFLFALALSLPKLTDHVAADPPTATDVLLWLCWSSLQILHQ